MFVCAGRFLRVVYTPLVSGLIKDHFHIPTALYEPSNPNSTLEKIVDAQQNDGGYDTFVRRMREEAKGLSVRFFFQHEVTSLTPVASAHNSAQSFVLGIRSLSGSERPSFNVPVASVMLNLPQRPLLRLLQSKSPSSPHHRLQKKEKQRIFPVQGLQVPMPVAAVKLYLHYDDAWWLNHLNLTSGGFESLEGMFSPTKSVCRGHWPCYPIPPQVGTRTLLPAYNIGIFPISCMRYACLFICLLVCM